jgi:ABC-2 type transport system permease protein
MFVQTVVSNKFVGHGILIGIFVLMPILFSFGWENTLYLVGQVPAYTYSDMNGYGHFVPALFWANTYWLGVTAVLGVVSMAFARRGAEDSLRSRARQALRLAPRLAPLALLFAVVAAGAGGWYFYNGHVLNEYLDSKARRGIQADYERKFKQYENLLQPKVTAVEATINIYPERRSFDGSVRMILQNKTGQPIPQIHVSDIKQSVSNLQFDRPFHLVSFMRWNSLWLRAKLSRLRAMLDIRRAGSATITSFRSLLTTVLSLTPTTFRLSVIGPTKNSTTRGGGAKSICHSLKRWRTVVIRCTR